MRTQANASEHPRVFISYRRRDDDENSDRPGQVSAFRQQLEGAIRRKIAVPSEEPIVFLDKDPAHLIGTRPWQDKLLDQLRQTSVFVSIMTANYLSRESDHSCKWEFAAYHDLCESQDGLPRTILTLQLCRPEVAASALGSTDWSFLQSQEIISYDRCNAAWVRGPQSPEWGLLVDYVADAIVEFVETPVVSVGLVTLAGEPRVGRPVTWRPEKGSTAADVSAVTSWHLDGEPVPGNQDGTFTPTAGQVGRHLSAVVTFRAPNHHAAVRETVPCLVNADPAARAQTPAMDRTATTEDRSAPRATAPRRVRSPRASRTVPHPDGAMATAAGVACPDGTPSQKTRQETDTTTAVPQQATPASPCRDPEAATQAGGPDGDGANVVAPDPVVRSTPTLGVQTNQPPTLSGGRSEADDSADRAGGDHPEAVPGPSSPSPAQSDLGGTTGQPGKRRLLLVMIGALALVLAAATAWSLRSDAIRDPAPAMTVATESLPHHPDPWAPDAITLVPTGDDGMLEARITYPRCNAPTCYLNLWWGYLNLWWGGAVSETQQARDLDPAGSTYSKVFSGLPNGREVTLRAQLCNEQACGDWTDDTAGHAIGPLAPPTFSDAGARPLSVDPFRVCVDATGDGNGESATLSLTSSQGSTRTVDGTGPISTGLCDSAAAYDTAVTFTATVTRGAQSETSTTAVASMPMPTFDVTCDGPVVGDSHLWHGKSTEHYHLVVNSHGASGEMLTVAVTTTGAFGDGTKKWTTTWSPRGDLAWSAINDFSSGGGYSRLTFHITGSGIDTTLTKKCG